MLRAVARRTLRYLFMISILTICIRYIALNYNWTEILNIFISELDLTVLLVGGIISILLYWFLRALRWYVILNSLGIKTEFMHLYMCSSISLAFSIVTPIQSGEAMKVELLKKKALLERVTGYNSFLFERAVDLFVVVLIMMTSTFFLLDIRTIQPYLYFVIAMMIFLFAGFLFLKKYEYKGKLFEFIKDLKTCIDDSKTLALVILLTLFSWMTVAAGWQACLYSVSINIGFKKSLGLMSIMTIVNILSLVPGAIGVSEAGIAGILRGLGLEAPLAQTGALVLRLYGILALFLGVLHFMIWRLLGISDITGLRGSEIR